MQNNRIKNQARLAIFFSGILMGFVGLFVNALSIIPTFAIVALRGLFGSIFIFLFLIGFRGNYILKTILKREPILAILQGIASGATIICYFYCIQLTTYGTAAFLLYTGPIFAVGIMWVFLHRIPSRRDLIAFGVALIGIILLTCPWKFLEVLENRKELALGLVFGILSGISLGILNSLKVLIFDKWEKYHRELKGNGADEIYLKKDRLFLNLGLANFTTVIIFFMFIGPSINHFKSLTPIHWIIALGLGLLPTALAFSLFNIGLHQDRAGDVLIFSYSETIVGAILTAVLDTGLTWELFIGGMFIICANILIITKKID